MDLLAQGSESFIYFDQGTVIKRRIRRPFLEEILDNRLRKERTTREFNILKKIHGMLNVPKPYEKQTYEFTMEYIDGTHPKLTPEIASFIGETLQHLHSHNIIHYDLTIFNLLETDQIYIIDFGLSFYSYKLEDKAMDLLVAISEAPEYEQEILESYRDEKVLKKLEEIKKRARYVH